MTPTRTLLLSAAMLMAGASLSAANVTWDITPGTVGAGDSAITGGAGIWDNALGNWTTDAGVNNIAWDNTLNAADIAVFQGATGTVTLNSVVNAGGLTFSTTGTGYTLSGTGTIAFGATQGVIDSSALSTGSNQATVAVALTGTAGLTINANGNLTAGGGGSTGRLVISGVNTGLTGGIAITGGLVNFTTSSAAGSAATTAGSGNVLTFSNGAGIYAGGALTLGNNIVLSTGGATLRATSGNTLTLNGVVSGSGSLTKTDSGTVVLFNAANTFTGALNIQAGVLQLGNVTGGGSYAFSGSSIAVSSGATLSMGSNSGGSGNQNLTFANLSAPISISGGTLLFAQNANATQLFGAAVAFSNTSTISISASSFSGHVANLNGNITGTGTLNITGVNAATGRTLNFNGAANNYTGSVVLGAVTNTATVNLSTTLGAADWTINNANWNLNLSAGTHTFKSLNSTFANNVQSISGTTVLDVGSGNTDSAFSGILANGSGSTTIGTASVTKTGKISLSKSGSGNLTLSGVNTYTGGTAVTAGTLTVAASGAIVNSTAGGITIASGATLAINGTLNITAATATIANSGIFTAGGTLNLNNVFDAAPGTTTYNLITGSGTNSGSFTVTGYSTSVFSNVSYNGATGVLTFTAVPEPSTYGLIGAGALAAVAMVRRRRKTV